MSEYLKLETIYTFLFYIVLNLHHKLLLWLLAVPAGTVQTLILKKKSESAHYEP